MNELKKGINDLAISNVDLMNAIGNRFSYIEDNSDTLTFPYTVFSFQPLLRSRTSGNRFSDVVLQFSTFDDSLSSELSGQISDLIAETFDDCESKIKISNALVLSFKHSMKREFKANGLWNSIIQYRVKLQLI